MPNSDNTGKLSSDLSKAVTERERANKTRQMMRQVYGLDSPQYEAAELKWNNARRAVTTANNALDASRSKVAGRPRRTKK